MGIVPKGRAKRIQWYITHVNKWAQDPEGIGLSADEVAELQARTEAARLARLEQRKLQDQARSATLRMKTAIADMSDLGSSMIHRIRAKAQMSGDVKVYARAWMPKPRKKRKSIGEPGKPYRFTFELQQNGWLHLRWKCDNPKGAMGTMYHVRRQLDFGGEFVFVGHVDKKKFTDKTLPAGVKSVAYEVQAVRTTGSGTAGTHIIRFGGASKMPEMRQSRAAA